MTTDNKTDAAAAVPLPTSKPKRVKGGNKFRLFAISDGGNDTEVFTPVTDSNYPSTKAAREAAPDEGKYVTILIRDRFEVKTIPQEPVRKITSIK